MKSSDEKASKCRLKFLSGSYIYVKSFHFNCIERDLYSAIRLELLNLDIGTW